MSAPDCSRHATAPRPGFASSSPPPHSPRAASSAIVAVWAAGTGLFALVVGVLSTSFTDANISANLREQLRKLGVSTITTPSGVLGFYFLLFVLTISLFMCSQIAAVRRDEADQRLETLFAFPVDRRRYLAGRLVLAAGGAATLALVAALCAWAGAAAQDAHVSLARLLEAGANCLPVSLLFLALGALAYALSPRAASGIAYGLVSAGFLWQLLGELLGAPQLAARPQPVPARGARARSGVPRGRGGRTARDRGSRRGREPLDLSQARSHGCVIGLRRVSPPSRR